MKPVLVLWRDSMGKPGWYSKETIIEFADMDDLIHESAGFLLQANDDNVTLVLSHGQNEKSVGDALKIPRECIMEIRRLNRGKILND